MRESGCAISCAKHGVATAATNRKKAADWIANLGERNGIFMVGRARWPEDSFTFTEYREAQISVGFADQNEKSGLGATASVCWGRREPDVDWSRR